MSTSVPLVAWIATAVGFLAIVVLDLVVIARRRSAVTMRQATLWVAVYVGLAAVFAGLLFALRGGTSGGEFVAGYITEYSLSVDNLFVFVIIMARFAVPALAVDKVLYIGIVLSMLLRAVFIGAGAAAIAAASWVFYIFGAFLVYTAIRLAFESAEGGAEYRENAPVRGPRRGVPLAAGEAGPALSGRGGRRPLVPPPVAGI